MDESHSTTAEEVAYKLLLHVMTAEGRPLNDTQGGAKFSRNVILDAYSDCLEAVRGNRDRKRRT